MNLAGRLCANWTIPPGVAVSVAVRFVPTVGDTVHGSRKGALKSYSGQRIFKEKT